MSKAAEMFEELGYEKRENKISIRYTFYDNDDYRFNKNSF